MCARCRPKPVNYWKRKERARAKRILTHNIEGEIKKSNPLYHTSEPSRKREDVLRSFFKFSEIRFWQRRARVRESAKERLALKSSPPAFYFCVNLLFNNQSLAMTQYQNYSHCMQEVRLGPLSLISYVVYCEKIMKSHLNDVHNFSRYLYKKTYSSKFNFNFELNLLQQIIQIGVTLCQISSKINSKLQ